MGGVSLLENGGSRLVGGCCGVQHIAVHTGEKRSQFLPEKGIVDELRGDLNGRSWVGTKKLSLVPHDDFRGRSDLERLINGP
jgi:hypothetical protein